MRRSPRRTPDRIYRLRDEHLALIAELDRLFPDRAPIVDFAAIPPGAESVELVSRHLYEALKRGFEHPVFVALCHLNSERLLDAIRVILDRGALPLADEEVLADTYVRLHRQLRPAAASFEPMVGWKEPEACGSLYASMTGLLTAVVEDQVEFLAACELPLPGLKMPELDPGDGAVRRCQDLLKSTKTMLPSATVRHWVAHALLKLPDPDRRILFLRERLGRSYSQIAVDLGVSPLAAAQQLRDAHRAFEDRIRRTMLAFRSELAAETEPDVSPGDPSPLSRERRPGGRLLHLPKSGPAPGGRLSRKQDDESDTEH